MHEWQLSKNKSFELSLEIWLFFHLSLIEIGDKLLRDNLNYFNISVIYKVIAYKIFAYEIVACKSVPYPPTKKNRLLYRLNLLINIMVSPLYYLCIGNPINLPISPIDTSQYNLICLRRIAEGIPVLMLYIATYR